jgi:RHS repeat-associated protein
MLGSSRTMVQAGGTSVCFDADFLPFGYEKDVTTTCTQNYKFEGKERDTETLNDDFGARYYTFRLGRWLSADWSSVPAPVPYANLTNPQTLNLYAMVSDNPESFADLDGHTACEAAGGTLPQGKCSPDSILASLEGEGFSFDENTGIRDWYLSEVSAARTQYAAQQAAKQNANKQEKKEKEKKVPPEVVVTPVSDTTHPSQYLPGVEERDIVYVPGTYDGTSFQRDFDASISFSEKTTGGNSTPVIDDKDHPRKGGVEDQIAVRNEHSTFQVTQRFTVNGKSARILRVDAGKVSLARTQTVNATATRIDVTPVP